MKTTFKRSFVALTFCKQSDWPQHLLACCAVLALALGGSLDCGAVAQDRKFVSSSRTIVGTATRLSASVRAGDVDGDGDIDLVVANGRHWPQQNILFVNHNRGRFTVARPVGFDLSTSYACELADLDGDQDLDIAVGNDTAPCLIFTNDGSGHFHRHCEFGQPTSVRSLTTADIDGDGDIDLLTTCRGRPNRIYFNDGHANFSESTTFGANTDSTIDVTVADLNKDGHNDLILANRDSQPNTILLGTGDGKFQAGVNFGDPKSSSRAVATADFDGDGHVDLVVGYIGSQNKIFYGDSTGAFIREVNLGQPDGRTYCVGVADLNNDGQPDVVFGNVGQVNSAFFSQNHAAQFNEQRFGDEESVTYGLCVSDLTGDGFPEIVTANSNQQNRIYLNQPVRKTAP